MILKYTNQIFPGIFKLFIRKTRSFYSIKFISLLFFLFAFYGCKNTPGKKTFSYNKKGYWWQLLSFNSDTLNYNANKIAWINACFKTQNDSVFYDSEHDIRDRFFIKTDSLINDNCLKYLVSQSSVGDSICTLINTKTFFKQQFKKTVPFFCAKDSVVKIYFKVKAILTEEEYKTITQKIINNERNEIKTFYSTDREFNTSRDSLGFYWVDRPIDNALPRIKSGDVININYQGAFLNGRIVDSSPHNFQIIYGTPDQLIKGLNYVISKLKIGQISKIILPSHLAFGENGSSNGSIPPYTPMLYKISITDIKNNK